MTPLRFIHVGTVDLGVALPVAAVDIDAGQLWRAQEGYGIGAERCYTDLAQAFAERAADADFVVVPPAAMRQSSSLPSPTTWTSCPRSRSPTRWPQPRASSKRSAAPAGEWRSP